MAVFLKTSSFRVLFLLIILVLSTIAALVLVKLIKTKRVYDSIAETSGDYTKFSEMIENNPDVVAWLSVDNTKISSVVVKGKDNLEYIDKDVNGNTSFAGTPFLDYRNNSKFSDVYSVIYGHYMEDHLMFADLELFEDPAFWDSERIGTLELANGKKYDISFFACSKEAADNSVFFDPVRVCNNWNDASFVNQLTQDALVCHDEIRPDDHILVLSTCVTAGSETRILVFGKLSESNN